MQTPPACCWLALLCVHLCVAWRKEKKTLLVALLLGGQETRGLVEQTECRWLWCGKRGCGREERRADEGGGITSSLPTRQPWVVLLGWSECNRLCFFRLTTGACEHTSWAPWERRLSWQSQSLSPLFCLHCPFLLLVYVSVSFRLVCAFLFVTHTFLFFLIVCNITRGDIIFCILFFSSAQQKAKHLGDMQSRLAVKSSEHLPPFTKILIESLALEVAQINLEWGN